jgi:hypothetical protein
MDSEKVFIVREGSFMDIIKKTWALELTLWGLHVLQFPRVKRTFRVLLGNFILTFYFLSM